MFVQQRLSSIFYHLQSVPSGIPELVEPSLLKIDLPHLILDIPKYERAGVFDSGVGEWWRSFLADFEAKYGKKPVLKPQWPLNLLGKVSGTDNTQSVVDPAISEAISLMHRNEQESRSKVHQYC